MKYGRKRTAWAITLDYENQHEILLGLIFENKSDAVEHFRDNLYKPLYNIVKIIIHETQTKKKYSTKNA